MAAGTPALLHGAVHQHSAFGWRGMLERMFTAWFGGFFYNQIWEDPRVDLQALRLNGESRILTISSAGCNVLNYLVDSPARITAVDLNPHHIYLTRLKLAAAECLPSYDDFFAFFGCADTPHNRENYYTYVRDRLDETTRYFWESGSWLRRRVLGPRIEYFTKNLYDYARLGYFLRFAHWIARALRIEPDSILRARTPEEQEAAFETTIGPIFDHWFVRALGRAPFFLFGIGIPPRQVDALREETGGQLVPLFRERVKRLACAHPVSDNYFTWQAFARRYDREGRRALPDYLKPEHYDAVRRGVDRVETRIDSLHSVLSTQEPGALDRFVFLDAQDWMRPEEIADLWAGIARVARPGARIIFRTASSRSPVETALPADLRRRFVYEEALSRELHAQDRAAIYGGFHVYSLPR
ncbi:MAG: DUF3419 family protein [Planctomycetota bacterium]